MQVEATTDGPLATDADTIVIGVFEGDGIAHDTPEGALQALLDSGEAKRAFKRLAVAHAEGRRWIIAGLGARDDFDAERARVAAAVAHGRARELGVHTLCWEVPHHVSDRIVAGLVEGTMLHAYRFDRYKHGDGDNGPGARRLLLSSHHDVADAVDTAAVVTAAQNRARDLANTPANDLPPEALAARAREVADEHHGMTVTVLNETEIREAGMGAFSAVAQGSGHGARLIALRYRGPGARGPRIALVGKAITFDSGGLSLKPATHMHEMKFDMCGGAAVIEALGALAELGAAVDVLGVVGSTENLPGPGAVKPGDIVRALDGTTIEVNNTDAEGRLVLADCLTYAIREGAERIVDIATLTGGVVVALGSVFSGLMGNDDALAELVAASGATAGERVWRLPLDTEYANMVKGRYADLANTTERREATAITAAEFLHRFAGEVPWAHIDIAGTAWGGRAPYFDKRATGIGVRLLVAVAQALAD
ncbi:MAG TPA: leucyl aminopeptidase [Solirubrobacteraceae bacterium]|nr:leucyl aminopeptidase [Solirubrobacteraceae bacterium]